MEKDSLNEVRTAVRFPLHLPMAVRVDSQERQGETENISAAGVLFQVDAEMPVGSLIEFTIAMPAEVLGTEQDIHVQCRGRVVRSVAQFGRCEVAAIIDEYRFQR